jgi:hypothetical protein
MQLLMMLCDYAKTPDGQCQIKLIARVTSGNFDCLCVAVLGDNQVNRQVVPEIQSSGRQDADKAV